MFLDRGCRRFQRQSIIYSLTSFMTHETTHNDNGHQGLWRDAGMKMRRPFVMSPRTGDSQSVSNDPLSCLNCVITMMKLMLH